LKNASSRRDAQVISAKAAAKQVPPVEPTLSHVETFILLQRELVDNIDCLFVFVSHPEVEPTNNRSERNVRREAEIRKGARTSKTDPGAKSRSIIVTVLAILQTRIARFTLSNVLEEVGRWLDTGKTLFKLELETFKATRAPPTLPKSAQRPFSTLLRTSKTRKSLRMQNGRIPRTRSGRLRSSQLARLASSDSVLDRDMVPDNGSQCGKKNHNRDHGSTDPRRDRDAVESRLQLRYTDNDREEQNTSIETNRRSSLLSRPKT